MTVAALDAHNLGFAIGALIIPLIGLILLIVGTVERARSQKQPPPMPPGYPAQASPPPSSDRHIPRHRPATGLRHHLGTRPQHMRRAHRPILRLPVIGSHHRGRSRAARR